MDLALVFSALMLGLAGAPHCAAMCGPGCAAVLRGCQGGGTGPATLAFHLGRVGGYALAGAVAAASVGVLAMLGQAAPALRPLWTLAHAAAMGLGLWLLWTGRQPAWMENLGRGVKRTASTSGGWQRVHGPLRAGAAGSLWVAWPCGLLQSALVIAALANTAVGGAAVMAAFAVASAGGLAAAPWLWSRLSSGPAAAMQAGVWATRAAGALLAAASAWALGHDIAARFIAYCFGG